jgi:hypothetical protein
LRPSQDAVKLYGKPKRTRMCKLYATSLNSFGGEGGSKYGILENVLCKKRRENQNMLETPDAVQNLNERDCSCFFVFDW